MCLRLAHCRCLSVSLLQPMWEDEANKEGGKWIIRLHQRDRNHIDQYWQNLVSQLSNRLPSSLADPDPCSNLIGRSSAWLARASRAAKTSAERWSRGEKVRCPCCVLVCRCSRVLTQVFLRAGGDRISIWNRNRHNHENILKLGYAPRCLFPLLGSTKLCLVFVSQATHQGRDRGQQLAAGVPDAVHSARGLDQVRQRIRHARRSQHVIGPWPVWSAACVLLPARRVVSLSHVCAR